MESNNICSSAVVAQVLKGKDNYEHWRACMKNYLLIRDLWDVVEETSEAPKEEDEADFKAWRKRDLTALHALQISCDPLMFAHIRNKTTAKDAWKTLADIYDAPVTKDFDFGRTSMLPLLKAISGRNLESTKNILISNQIVARLALERTGSLALHFAIFEGQLAKIYELLKTIPIEDLGNKDFLGRTVLHYAAMYSKIIGVAEVLIQKKYELLFIQDNSGAIPLIYASRVGHKRMTRFLYSLTTREFLLSQENETQAVKLVVTCIGNKWFDIALDMLSRCPELAFVKCNDETDAFLTLSSQPSAFFSSSGFSFWQRWIYYCLWVKKPKVLYDVRINTYELQDQKETKKFMTQVGGQILGLLGSYLLKFFGIKRIYKLKRDHVHASELLRLLSKKIAAFGDAQIQESCVHQAIFNAAQLGMKEFIVEIVKANIDLLLISDEKDRTIFEIAVAHRQEKVFSLIYALDTANNLFSTFHDKDNNNMLHLAGELSKESELKLQKISGEALQMQRELQWFKEVERIIPHSHKEHKNIKGETPCEVFDRSHTQMLLWAEEWMKEIAQSSTIIATLIITIMFAALFTVPGALNQDTGVPLLLRKRLFKVFIISDAISLFASTTSVLISVGILTSRYAANDFLKSLPNQLIIGLSSLFVCIAAMMVAFSSAVILTLPGYFKIYTTLVVLASIPIGLFAWLQFPLLVRILFSTYWPMIFDRKMKKWL